MRKRSARILIGFGITFVAVSLLYAVAVAVSAARLRRVYAALERDGRPMTAAEIIPPKVPDAQNAALLYESAALLLQGTPAPEKENLRGYLADLAAQYVDNSPGPNARAELQQLFQEPTVSQALSIIAEASRRPACRFNYNYDAGPSMKMPDLGMTRDLARILAAKACLEAESADPNAAWETVWALLALSDARRAEPAIINQLVRMGSFSLSCRTIRRLCETTLPTDAQYRRLSKLLETLDDIQPLVRAGDGERLLFVERTFTLPRDRLYQVLQDNLFSRSYWPPVVHRLRFAWVRFRPNLLGDHAAALQLLAENMRLLDRPYSRELRQRLDREYYETPNRYLLTHTLLPYLYSIKAQHCRMVADVHLTRAGLALLRYQEPHGDFPQTLDGLDIQGIDDPFSGKPLIYHPQGKGFILYSVGEDQRDNGGVPRPQRQDPDPRKRHAEYDLVWRFPSAGTP